MNYLTTHDIETTINLYEKHNIFINYIFDNSNVTKDDLSDRFSNLMLNLAHKKGNGVYVKSDILFDYIKNKYPLYKIIKIVSASDFDKKNIAIDPKYNNTFKAYKIKYKNNTYITLNSLCPNTCKHYDEHRKYIEQEQSNYYAFSNIYLCPLNRNLNFYDLSKNSNFISEFDLNEYIKSGFRKFRIHFPYIAKCIDINYSLYDTIESYVYYLIKPEFKEEIRHLIIKKFSREKKWVNTISL